MSRQGREFQVYEDGRRCVVGVIPVLPNHPAALDPSTAGSSGSGSGSDAGAASAAAATSTPPRIVLVSSRKDHDRWVLPKGGWDLGAADGTETRTESAAREAWEEAGLRGSLADAPVWEFDEPMTSTTGIRTPEKTRTPCRYTFFAMAVDERLATWPEAGERARQAFSVDEALDRLARHHNPVMRDALQAWVAAHPALMTPSSSSDSA
ncbi:hypothetical protein CXG81DRAFT_16422 [Caulochytrium protostelioides]|uniref:Nudix hydrolase domain-containing protein n=1 Tax=Caulochytrium protostelioides TaxID=1555241 RepID=A0A4V1IVI1_9FUNG|nr:hypothetical protein CXG81DRAFT_16422 [Caulochytrium protostelioides]|eukprot:RKP04139.1 hypothetical protein CXG81DRAFT_16422 [Caulochytrium protostelioides]